MRTTFRASAIAATMVLAGLLAGCGGGDDGDDPTSPGGFGDQRGFSFGGAYTMTIETAPTCDFLPEEVRRRSYRVDVTESQGVAVNITDPGSRTQSIDGHWIGGQLLLGLAISEQGYQAFGQGYLSERGGDVIGALQGQIGPDVGSTCNAATHRITFAPR